MAIVFKPIEIYDFSSKEAFIEYVRANRKPLVVRGLDIGNCAEKWNVNYLADSIKSVPISVHVSPTGKMSFLKKNFTYMKIPFDEFIHRASGENKTHCKPLLCQNEVLYFRSVSFDKRGKECSDLTKHFPSIAGDFNIPEVFNSEDFFSSVFRIASRNVQVWTHYDIMDNILVQVCGSKRVTLFSPEDAPFLYMVGDKSEVPDIYNPDVKKFPLFLNALQHEATLHPGEAIFIPALWFHSTFSESFSVSVNVFWKNLPHELYDKHDVYGNKDLLPANKAFLHLKKALEALKTLPYDYRKFYVHRCISDLKRSLDVFDEPRSHPKPECSKGSTSDEECPNLPEDLTLSRNKEQNIEDVESLSLNSEE